MQQYQQAYRSPAMARPRTEVVNAFLRGVYMWMTMGLGVTAIVTALVITVQPINELFITYFRNPETGAIFARSTMLGNIIGLAAFGMIMYMFFNIQRMSVKTATIFYFVFNVAMGIGLASLVANFTDAEVFQAFIACAGMFAAMSIYGLTTKRDLTGLGSFMFMGLIGLIIALLVNWILQSSAMTWIISIFGVIIFTGLTAFDTQNLKIMGDTAQGAGEVAVKRATIFGALRLYLDFINLFQFLLILMGGGRD